MSFGGHSVTSHEHSEELLELAQNGKFGFVDRREFRVVKSRKDCIVLETEGCFFKIVRIDADDKIDCFEQLVRKATEKEMQARDVGWEVFTSRIGDKAFSVEKREPLTVISESELACEEVLKKSHSFTASVEKWLELPRLTAQIREFFCDDNVVKIVLSRDVPFEHDDFAWANGEVVPLSSTRWFLAVVGSDGEWRMQTPADVIPVKLREGEFFFAKKSLFDSNTWAIGELFEPTAKWWLFDVSAADARKARSIMIDEVKEMFDENLKIAVTKRPMKVDSAESHGSMIQECERLGLKGEDGGKLLDEENAK